MMLLFLTQLAATLYMTGVIVFVQVVHYPLFAGVGEEGFIRYAQQHANRTSLVVLLPMVLELLTAALFILWRPAVVPLWEAVVGFGLVCGLWLSTFFVQVPMHTRLQKGFDAAVQRALVRTNLVRTLLWSLRAGLILVWTYRLIS